MKTHARALRSVARAALVWLALAPSACSLKNTNQISCTADADCIAAFGPDAVCRSDGFCAGGGGDGTDGGNDGSVADGSSTDGRVIDGGNDPEPWTFVSFPDFLNYDLGDVSALTTAVNSTNAAHEAAVAAVLDAMAAEEPDFVLVAGDLVNGHWYLDTSNQQVFGPVGTLEQKTAAVITASDLYYSQWKQRFIDRGLTPVYAALGDHEVGDNNWPANQDKSFLVPTFKQQWAKHFTLDGDGNSLFPIRPVTTPFENTAYATRHKNLMIVTVDEFRQDDPTVTIDSRTGSVRNDVVGEQLAWLDSVLATAAADPLVDHVIVQGHVPVLTPVRQLSSSGLTMPGGGDSEFWQTLSRHRVDLYFAGEVHDMSTGNHAGVEQVVHGGIMGYAPRVSYLVGRVYPDRIELELKMAELVYPANDTTRMWQAGSNRPRSQYAISSNGFTLAGTLVIDKSSGATQYLNRTGYFIPLGGSGTTSGLAVHLPFDESSGNSAGNHGTTGAVNNASINGATFVAGKIGNAVLMDTADRIVAGPTPVLGAQTRTTSVWVRTVPSAVIRTVFSFGTNMSGGKWDNDVDAAGLFELGVAQGRTDGTGNSPVTDGAWHHLVTVLPQGASTLSAVRMYLDGNPIAFLAPSTTVDTRMGNLLIGLSPNAVAPQPFDGTIDDFAMWAEELDPGQVRALYSLGNEPTLNYDASEAQAMFASFEAQQDVTITSRLWRYQASGLTSTLGQVVMTDGNYSINLGGGAGFVSP